MNTACPSETALQGRIIGERVVVVRPSPLRNNKENSVAQIKIPDLSLPKDVGYVVIDRHEGRENKKRSRGTSHASSSQEIGTPNHEVQGETTPIRILSEQKTPSSQLQWNGQIPQRNLCQYSQQPYQSVSRLDSSLTHQPAAKIHYSSTTSPYIQHYSPIVHQPEPFHYHQPQVTTYPTIPSTISHSIHQYAAKEQPLLGSISQQTFESPASKQIQLQQSSVHLDSNLPSEFNTYNSVGMKRDFSKPPQHGTSQDDMGSEGKIVIRSRSPSISQKAYSDMQYIPNAHHQQSRESTVSRVTSVQEDLNQMSRNSGTMSNTHELSTGFERSSQAPVLHSDFPHQKAQQYISHSHYNTAGSTYNHSRKFDDSKTQGLLAKIQELRDTNEMKDSQVLLLHRENSILKDNIELLKRKVQVVSSDLRDKGSMLKQRESEIQQLTHSLTHFTNKQFYVNEASTQTDQILELPTVNDDRNCNARSNHSLFLQQHQPVPLFGFGKRVQATHTTGPKDRRA